MKDINDVLREKERELGEMQRLIFCLKFVAPYLVEDKDVLPAVKPSGEEAKRWP